MPEIERINIGIFKIPPPETLPSKPHITRQILNVRPPSFDWTVPSYEPLQWNKRKMQYVKKTKPSTASNPQPTPTTEPASVKPPENEVECPGPSNLRIGDIRNTEAREKVVDHKIVDGKCIEIYAPTTFTDKYLPSASVAATTFGITIVATAAASLTPVLTRILKPIFKQLINRAKKMLGKKPPKLTVQDKRTNAYREKKGLPPMK